MINELSRFLWLALYILYTAKSEQPVLIVDKNRIKQCFAANVIRSCQQYCSALPHHANKWMQETLATYNAKGKYEIEKTVDMLPGLDIIIKRRRDVVRLNICS